MIGLINVKSGVPSHLFVIRLTDDTKKTLPCSIEDQNVTITVFLKRKMISHNFSDDYNTIRDKVSNHLSILNL